MCLCCVKSALVYTGHKVPWLLHFWDLVGCDDNGTPYLCVPSVITKTVRQCATIYHRTPHCEGKMVIDTG